MIFRLKPVYGGIYVLVSLEGICVGDQFRKSVTRLDFRMTRMFCVCRSANSGKVEDLLKTPRQLRLRADLEVFVVLKIEKQEIKASGSKHSVVQIRITLEHWEGMDDTYIYIYIYLQKALFFLIKEGSELSLPTMYQFEYGETHLQNLFKSQKTMKETCFQNGWPGQSSCRRRPLVSRASCLVSRTVAASVDE